MVIISIFCYMETFLINKESYVEDLSCSRREILKYLFITVILIDSLQFFFKSNYFVTDIKYSDELILYFLIEQVYLYHGKYTCSIN